MAMPRVPGLSDLLGLLQQQSEALAALPRTMLDLNRSVQSLIDVVASARDTLASSQRVSAHLERIVDEMEEPILALKPGLERLAVVLSDPAVDTVPDTLRKINEDVLPLVQGIRETQGKVNNIATLAEETSNRLAGLPGAGFLLGRRAKSAATGVPQPEAGAEQPIPNQEPVQEAQPEPVQEAAPQPDQPGNTGEVGPQ
jgi:ABC-type transporter Mla subunit MlaD